MKKIYGLCLMLFLSIFIANNTFANVDSTNSLTFKYNCIDGVGTLYTTYSLGGHHLYKRTYNINTPGIIEVSDSNHTTISKSALISIDGCGYEAPTCTPITNKSSFSLIDRDEIGTLNINTDASVVKLSENKILVKGFELGILKSSATESKQDLLDQLSDIETEILNTNSNSEIYALENEYSEILSNFNFSKENVTLKYKNKTIELNGLNTIITIIKTQKKYTLSFESYKTDDSIIVNSGVVSSQSRDYDLESGEFFDYEIADNNKSVTIYENVYSMVQKGVTDSITGGGTQTYKANGGTNTGDSTCGDPTSKDGDYTSGYCTGLEKWDYNQHHYTTTNVTLHSVKLSCEIKTLTNGTKEISVEDFEGTLSGITEAEFGGDVEIETEDGTIGSLDDFGSVNIPASKTMNIAGLEYLKVGEIAKNKLGVNKVIVSIKQNDYTLGVKEISYGESYATVGSLPDISSLTLKDSDGNYITTKAGSFQLVFSYYDTDQLIGTYSFPLEVIPNNEIVLTKNNNGTLTSTNLGLENITGNTTDSGAGNDDYISFETYLVDEYGNTLSVLPAGRNFSVSVTKGGDRNLVEGGYGETIFTKTTYDAESSKLTVYIYSYAPFSGEVAIDVSVQKYDYEKGYYNDYSILSQSLGSLTFNKIFKADIKNLVDGVMTDGTPEIGTTMNYGLDINGNVNGVDDFSIDNYLSNIKSYDNDVVVEYKNITSNIKGNSIFDLRLNSTKELSEVTPGVIIENGGKSGLIVNYSIDGKKIRYYLNDNYSPTSEDYLSLVNNSEFLGLKIYGESSLDGKDSLVGYSNNIDLVDKASLRTAIRKKSYEFIKPMTSGQVVNGIKYVKGDYTLESTPSYNTIIVEDGNLIVKNNINLDSFYIVVLKDGYNIENGYDSGNVIVAPGVTNINAFIYADGGLISGDSSGNIYTTDTSSRSDSLIKQLRIYGGLFTRNTVGGAILGDGKYLLPGNVETTSFDRAMNYDLNYLRVLNEGWDVNNNGSEDDNEDENSSVIVTKDSNIINNMPSIFTD